MWKTVKLRDIISLQNGYAFKSSEYVEDGYFVMRITNVQEGYISKKNPKYVSIETSSTLLKFKLNEGDILISLTGNVGRVGMIKEEHLPAVLNQRVAKVTIIATEHVLKDFVFMYLNSDVFLKQSETLAQGAAQANVSTKDILDIELQLPPLPEQKRIVAKLDKAFAEIDSIKKNIGKKFTYLDLFLETILNLTSLTNESKKIKLQEVCQIKAKLVSPKDEPYLNKPHIGAGNIISLSNQLIDVLTAKEEKLISGKFPFETDSVLYSKIRPYLRKVHLPEYSGICSADIYPLVADEKKISREYLYFLLLSKNFTAYAISTSARAGMPKVNRESLFNFKFCLPDIESQKKIVKKIKNIFSNFSKIKQINKSKIIQFENLKFAILKKELQSEAV